jgi:hypothetical protein
MKICGVFNESRLPLCNHFKVCVFSALGGLDLVIHAGQVSPLRCKSRVEGSVRASKHRAQPGTDPGELRAKLYEAEDRCAVRINPILE